MIRHLTFALSLLCTAPVAAGPFEFCKLEGDSLGKETHHLPADAVQVFTHEGRPHGIKITKDFIAVDYGQSGVLFDRATGMVTKRLTIIDGWHKQKPEAFQGMIDGRREFRIVGPGVVEEPRRNEIKGPDVACSAEFDGRSWRALQPHRFLWSFDRSDLNKKREDYGAWTPILNRLNEESHLEAIRDGAPARKFTTTDGLASNVVTHLAVADGSLWAACVDIFDPKKTAWGPGGLCRFDPKTSRWERVGQIDGKAVRFVTLLEAIGGELWVGFREGEGVVGDEVEYSMGLYPGLYGPKTKSVVLARLKDGRWTSFARPPRLEPKQGEKVIPPTEVPRQLARTGRQVIVYSTVWAHHHSGNWNVPLHGAVSMLDQETGRWRLFDTIKDLDADELTFLAALEGEVVVASNRAAHRWDAGKQAWQPLRTDAPVRNPVIGAAGRVGAELWVGYSNQSFGVVGEQGISRFDEKTGKWTHLSHTDLGTGCPVQAIRAMPNGDVWILFGYRPWLGSSFEFPLYPRELEVKRPDGVGRFSGGRWQFPIKLEGVPEQDDIPWTFSGSRRELVRIGHRLYLLTSKGVYEGPDKWRQVLDGNVLALYSSADGKSLIAFRNQDKDGARFTEKGTYDPAAGKWMFEKLKERAEAWNLPGGRNIEGEFFPAIRQDSTEVPTVKPGRWAVSGLDGNFHAVLPTPSAVWLISPGQLVRLDKSKLAEFLGKPAE